MERRRERIDLSEVKDRMTRLEVNQSNMSGKLDDTNTKLDKVIDVLSTEKGLVTKVALHSQIIEDWKNNIGVIWGAIVVLLANAVWRFFNKDG